MKRSAILILAGLLAVALWPAYARAQGAIIETLEDLRDVPHAPEFRGVLPARIDLPATVPRPGDQGPSGSCTSWGTTYPAASQAGRRAGLGLASAEPFLHLQQDFSRRSSPTRHCRIGHAQYAA